MNSEYLNKFKALQDPELRSKFKLYGPKMYIEVMPHEEKKTAGGIIIAESSSHARAEYGMLKSTLAIVLAVGEGYVTEDSEGNIEKVPMEVKPGNVIWIADMGLKYCTTVPGLAEGIPEKTIGLLDEKDVIQSWEDIDAYLEYTKKLSN